MVNTETLRKDYSSYKNGDINVLMNMAYEEGLRDLFGTVEILAKETRDISPEAVMAIKKAYNL